MLTKTETKVVMSLGQDSFEHAQDLHAACVGAVRKAYGNMEDKGEFGQAIVDAVRVTERVETGRFLRKWGLNVTIDHKSVIVGDVVNRKNQAKHLTGCVEDLAHFQLVDAHCKAKAAPKAKTGSVSEQADEAIAALVKRVKADATRGELAESVAAEINNRLSQKVVTVEVGTVLTITDAQGNATDLSQADYDLFMEFMNKRHVALAGVELKLAA
jgi:hypothetical protein